jgi:hypothetical protein
VKLSINHHLLDRDRGESTLAPLLRGLFLEMEDERLLVLNIRLRRDYEDDDRASARR